MEISKNVTWKPLGEKIVAVKVDTGEYYTMNEVASLIWKSISEGLELEDIVQQVLSVFDNDDTEAIMTDIKAQISEWKQELLIL